MAGSPSWKAYSATGEYIASFKWPIHAAMFVAAAGGEIRYGHTKAWTVWREGMEEISAAESYDVVAEIMSQRVAKLQKSAYAKVYGLKGDLP